MLNNVMFGADPELFLTSPDGKFISSIGKIGGTKLRPREIGMGSAVQEDNVAVEFNTAPAATKEDFIRSLQHPLAYLKSYAHETLGLGLAIVPSAIFDEDQLNSPQARIFGCEPDQNAWTGEVNSQPRAPKGLEGLRTAGGHVHVSWDDRTNEEAVQLVRALDLYLGVPSVFKDNDDRRRTLYGKAGAFRHKSYGVEYRTLSNFWIQDEVMIGWTYDHAMRAVDFVNQGGEINTKSQALILQSINLNNKRSAKVLVKYFGVPV